MKNQTENHVAIYSRKSRFTGKGESIENQIELCKQYIQAHYGQAAADTACIYEDEGFSGGTLERPRFKAMMADARKKQFSAIICYRLDRISRNIGDFAKLIEELNHLDVAFVSIKEQFDTASPMGRAMMYIASVFSQLERETIAERIRDNMHELSKTGRWLGGVTPTGYCSEGIERVTIEGRVKRACQLKLIPEEARLVQLIFATFLQTGSLTKTETYLIQHGYTTKNNKQFTRFATKGILTNPVYMCADAEAYQYLVENQVELFSCEKEFDSVHGLMAYNRTEQQPGKANQLRSMDEWIVSVGRHEGIIAGADWIRVQRLISQNRAKGYRKPRSNVALLSGLLVCGSCGSYLRPKLTQRQTAQRELVYTYMCSLKERSRGKSCQIKNINGNELDRGVVMQLKQIPIDIPLAIQQLKQGKHLLTDGHTVEDGTLEHLQKMHLENENEIHGLVTSLAKAGGSMAEEYIIAQIAKLHEKNQQIGERMQQLAVQLNRHTLTEAELNDLLEQLLSFQSVIGYMQVEQKRQLVRSLVHKVLWDGAAIHIYLSGAKLDETALVQAI